MFPKPWFKQKKIGSISLIEKWNLLLPEFNKKYPEFKNYLAIRNNSIIHFKDNMNLDIKHIVDLNYVNAKNLTELVSKMMLEYKIKMRDVWDIIDPNCFYSIFIQNINLYQDMAKEIISHSKKE